MRTEDDMQEDINLDNALIDSIEAKSPEKQNESSSKEPEVDKSNSDTNINGQSYNTKQELKNLTRERDLLKKASETNLGKLQYLLADYDNYRKQVERLTDDRIDEKRVHIISKLIEIYDDFCKEMDLLKYSSCPPVIAEGFNGILNNFDSLLKSEGIREIESLGKLFDPDIHDPVSFAESTAYPEKTIVEVKRKGYMLNNKLLRPSMVVLSRKARTSPFKSVHKDDDNVNPSQNNNRDP
jgi:molecular chaperone GrpE